MMKWIYNLIKIISLLICSGSGSWFLPWFHFDQRSNLIGCDILKMESMFYHAHSWLISRFTLWSRYEALSSVVDMMGDAHGSLDQLYHTLITVIMSAYCCCCFKLCLLFIQVVMYSSVLLKLSIYKMIISAYSFIGCVFQFSMIEQWNKTTFSAFWNTIECTYFDFNSLKPLKFYNIYGFEIRLPSQEIECFLGLGNRRGRYSAMAETFSKIIKSSHI